MTSAQIYLVGGAVRDQALHQPIQERDWVVVGSTSEQMEQLGYKRVGRSFPVFLHPQTQEEYALARSEKKLGPKHIDFSVDFAPTTTLEEDLLRRDLTLNAMAMDDSGRLIDPFHGLEDLQNGIFRHVSEAFSEDPLRILRLARFQATAWGVTFQVASSTEALVRAMVARGELRHLSKSRIWRESEKAYAQPHPQRYFSALGRWGALEALGVQGWHPDMSALIQPDAPAYRQLYSPALRHAFLTFQASKAIEDLQQRRSFLLTWQDALGVPKHAARLTSWASQQFFCEHLKRWAFPPLPLEKIAWHQIWQAWQGWRNPSEFHHQMRLLMAARCDLLDAACGEREMQSWSELEPLWHQWIDEAQRLKLSQEALQQHEGPARSEQLQHKRFLHLKNQSQQMRS